MFIGSAGAIFNFSVGLFQWTGGILSVAYNGGHTLTNAGTINLAGSAAKTLAAGSRKCGGLRRSFRSLRDDSEAELGMSAAELSTVVMKLELKKVIRRLPGNQYERR